MIRRPPRSTRTDTLFPYTTLFRSLVALTDNPIDSIWRNRPPPCPAKLLVHPDRYSGKSSTEKRQEIAGWLKEKRADAAVLPALDSIDWVFNFRGRSEERRVGKEWVSTCRSRWSPYH